MHKYMATNEQRPHRIAVNMEYGFQTHITVVATSTNKLIIDYVTALKHVGV